MRSSEPIRLINTTVRIVQNVEAVFEGDQNFVVVSVLVDESYTQDRCTGCAWGAWPEYRDLNTGGVQRWGPLTTIGAYTYMNRENAVVDVEGFMSRQGYTKTDPDDYDDEEAMFDSPEYDPFYEEAMKSLELHLRNRPSDQFTIWDGFGYADGRAPRFAIHVALVGFGDS
jgi:hypothetical protein